MSEVRRFPAISPTWLFAGAGIAFWGLLAGPAWLVADMVGLLGLSIAAVLCVLPGCLALGLQTWFGHSQGAVVLVASGLRFGLVLAGALCARVYRPEFGIKEFFVWLILFYLFTLAMETWLVLKPQKS